MDHTKIDTSYLDSPRQELSNGSLGLVVALRPFLELIFRVFVLVVQSSCTCWWPAWICPNVPWVVALIHLSTGGYRHYKLHFWKEETYL